MTHDLARVAARLFNAPLALRPDVAETIAANLAARFGAAPAPLKPKSFDDDGGGDLVGGPGAEPYRLADGVATIAVRGELVNRGSWLDAASGLTSYDNLSASLRKAEADPLVRAVLLDIDSPGGEAAGMVEAASVVRGVAKSKPVTAWVNGTAASAAYALAAGASEIVLAPSAIVGSIGVVCLHMDHSGMLAEAGLKPTLIHAGAFKTDANPMEPLGGPARARVQAMIDGVYDLFVASVGAHRPKLGEKGARGTEAGVYMGQKAVDAGLADQVGALEAAMARLRRKAAPSSYAGSPRMAVELYKAGESHAASLISAGKVDKTSSWSFSAEDGDALLGSGGDDWANYAKFHLGEDAGETDKTKARWKYPHGKAGKVYRSGIIAAKQRAAAQGADEIEAAAGRLLEKIDGEDDDEDDKKEARLAQEAAEAHRAGVTEGAASAQARIKAILGCEEAKGREPLAQHLAFNTILPVDEVKAALAATPLGQAPAGGRMERVPKPPVRPDGAPANDAAAAAAEADAHWTKIAADLNKRPGFRA